MISFQPGRLTHVGPIASNMRTMDRVECDALGRTPKSALRNGLRCSLDAWTTLKDGRPISMMGVVSDGLLTGSATVWFLGTDEVFREGRALVSYGPLFFERWLQLFDRLHNVVAVENRAAIRLLHHWGFEVSDQVKVYRGVEFVSFEMLKHASPCKSQPSRERTWERPTSISPPPRRRFEPSFGSVGRSHL